MERGMRLQRRRARKCKGEDVCPVCLEECDVESYKFQACGVHWVCSDCNRYISWCPSCRCKPNLRRRDLSCIATSLPAIFLPLSLHDNVRRMMLLPKGMLLDLVRGMFRAIERPLPPIATRSKLTMCLWSMSCFSSPFLSPEYVTRVLEERSNHSPSSNHIFNIFLAIPHLSFTFPLTDWCTRCYFDEEAPPLEDYVRGLGERSLSSLRALCTFRSFPYNIEEAEAPVLAAWVVAHDYTRRDRWSSLLYNQADVVHRFQTLLPRLTSSS